MDAEKYLENEGIEIDCDYPDLKTVAQFMEDYAKQKVLEHSVELAKILISNPIEKCGKTPQELVEQYYEQTFKQ